MTAEIISIGTELLLGQINDTNATFISERLCEIGVNVNFRTTVGDNINRIIQSLDIASQRADIIIVTGGLGPTFDDITVGAAAKFFGVNLVKDAATEEKIKTFVYLRGLPMNELHLKQALVPENSIIINNNVGTAPGILFEKNAKTYFFMPGVPREMKGMLDSILEHLKIKFEVPQIIVKKTLKAFGTGESNLQALLPSNLLTSVNPSIAFLASKFVISIRITAKAENYQTAMDLINPVAETILQSVGDYIYGVDEDTLESVVVKLLTENKFTLACAESCTGGLLAHRITTVPGASEVFLGSLVTYTTKAKVKILGFDEDILLSQKLVSEATASEMAEKAACLLNASFGVGITGNTGPTVCDADGKVGEVFIAIYNNTPSPEPRALSPEIDTEAQRHRGTENNAECEVRSAKYEMPETNQPLSISLNSQFTTQRFQFAGRREDIKYLSTSCALEMLRSLLLGKKFG